MKRLLLASVFLAISIGAASAACSPPAVMKDNASTTFNMSMATANDGNCASSITVQQGGLASGAGADGWDATQGAKADAAWVSGSGSVIAILKNIAGGIAAAVAAGTNYIGQFGLWTGLSSYVYGTTSAMTGTSSTQLLAAVTSKQIYVTSISCVNSHATVGTFVTVQDGSGGTTLGTLAAASVYGGHTMSGSTPIFKPTTAGNGLFVADATTGANVICTASGFAQ